MNLYIKENGPSEGYFDALSVIDAGYTFNYITGGRGIGKTYGFIEYFISRRIPFVLMRRTQTEANIQADPLLSGLRKHLNSHGIKAKYDSVADKKITNVWSDDGYLLCQIVALATLARLRGIDFEPSFIVYDEFITEPHVKAMREEGFALKNAYETINRNRELEGLAPVRMFCLSNSLNLANDIFIYNDLVTPAEFLVHEGKEIYTRGDTLLVIAQHSPISEKKAGTALYKDDSGEFYKMAIQNKFILNDFTYVKRIRNLQEYRCLFGVGDVYLYRHKSRPEYYAAQIRAQTPNYYGANKNDLQRFQREQRRIYGRYLDGAIKFDSYETVALFEKYYK